MHSKVPRPVKREDGKWWIPRLPPHWMQAQGPYDTLREAEEDRAGLECTINSPPWRSMIMDDEDV